MGLSDVTAVRRHYHMLAGGGGEGGARVARGYGG